MNLKFRLANSNKGVLLQNTVMLYLLTFSNYFLSLVVVPYETRVLGVEVFGVLGAATAIMVYFQLVVDFGFLLSGTQEVAKAGTTQLPSAGFSLPQLWQSFCSSQYPWPF